MGFASAIAIGLTACGRGGVDGIADFPDPTANGLPIPVNAAGDLNVNNPTFQDASKLRARKTGLPAFASGGSQSGRIELNGAGPGGAGG